MDALDIDLARSLHAERARAVEERNRLALRDGVATGALVHARRE